MLGLNIRNRRSAATRVGPDHVFGVERQDFGIASIAALLDMGVARARERHGRAVPLVVRSLRGSVAESVVVFQVVATFGRRQVCLWGQTLGDRPTDRPTDRP